MTKRTAEEAGWKYSDYNLFARVPENQDLVAWINTLESVCSEMSIREYALLTKILTFPEDHPLIEHYAKRGIITNEDEKEKLREMFTRNLKELGELRLTICPTMGCNFDCPYCFEKHIPGKMSEETQDRIVSLADRILAKEEISRLYILWFGGEPLLYPGIIESLSKRLIETAERHQAEYAAEIITNGYLLDERAIRVLEEARVTKVQVTLDGMKEAHDRTRHLTNRAGTFDVIVKNLRQEMPFRVQIRHNVTHENAGEQKPLEEFVKQLKEETGNDYVFYAAPVFDSTAAQERGREVSMLNGSESEAIVFEREAQEFGNRHHMLCEACRQYALTIDHEGRLYCCCEKAGDPGECYGDLASYDPDEPYATAARPEIQKFYLDVNSLFEGECRDCEFLPKCAGGCAAKRRAGKPECPEYRTDPDSYVLGLYRYLKARYEERHKSDDNEQQVSGQKTETAS